MNFAKRFDMDYPSSDRRVASFNKDDKYKLIGRVHSVRSNAIRYFPKINRNFVNKKIRDALKIIKSADEIYILGPSGTSIIMSGKSARSLVRKNRGIILNTLDLLNDKDLFKKELNQTEHSLLDIANEITNKYIKAIKEFTAGTRNIDSMKYDAAKKLIKGRSVIKFKKDQSTVYFFRFSDGGFAEFKSNRFITFKLLDVSSKQDIIDYWNDRINTIQSENFKNIIRGLQGIEIGGFEKKIELKPQDDIEKIAPELIAPPKPIDPEIKKEINRAIKSKMKADGFETKPTFIINKEYWVGKKEDGQKKVIDWDGKEYDYDTFVDIAKERSTVEKKLNNIHKVGLYLGTIEKVSDKKLRELVQNKDITYEFLTDNKLTKNKLTRSYPIIEYEGKKLIVGGRFRGYYLEDMINRIGRQVAGSSYVLDENGKARLIEYKEGELTKFRVEHEPYLTKLKNGDLRLILPDWAKSDSKKLVEVSKIYKTIKVNDKKFTSFDIAPEDFDIINDILGGLTMSESASLEITRSIENRRKIIEIETKELYKDVTTETIPKMRTTDALTGMELNLMVHQQKSIKIVTEKEGNTVVGLDTGTGKTLTGIGIFLIWLEDGTLEKHDKNGKALFVVPPALRGNFPATIRRVCEDYEEIMKHVEVISYTEFQKNPNNYKKYGAIFFDEAQKLRKTTAKVSRAALELDHPRKIPLTASVLEKSPMDLFNLVSVAKNYYKNPMSYKRLLQKFILTFCEKIDGKVVGLKENPATKRKFRQWVKENTLFIDKTDVKEFPLPPVTPIADQTEAITMDKKVSRKYNELSKPIADTLKRMVAKYKEKTLKTTELNQELSKVMGHIQMLRNFLNNPDDYIEGILNPKVERLKEKLQDYFHKQDSIKVLSFTDSPALAEKAGIGASEEIPLKKHIVALANEIIEYQNGKKVKSYKQTSKLYYDNGDRVPKKDWQIFVLGEYNRDSDVATFNLTKAYTTGYNLQSTSVVIHLDRDTWNNEQMKQRTARTWRTGQLNSVDVSILDLVNDSGTSLDVIQKYSMEIERDLFDSVVKASADIELKQDINIEDIKSLVKNKDAFRYLMNPDLQSAFGIENVSME